MGALNLVVEALSTEPSTLVQHLLVLIASFIFWIAFAGPAWLRGYFSFPKEHFIPPPSISFSNAMGAFAVFLAVEIILIPAFAYAWFAYQSGQWLITSKLHLSNIMQGWFNLFTVLIAFAAIFLYLQFLPSKKLRFIFWGNEEKPSFGRAIRGLLLGAFTWLLSYPTVLILSQLIQIILLLLGSFAYVDQTAVKNLKTSLEQPSLFWATTLAIIFIVPLVEETLFRGFIQRYTVARFGRLRGILIAAIIFAAFHFSVSQGVYNVELLLSLFVLACYLGFIYERQGTLWAPIGLHMTFNAISVFMIVGQELSKANA